MQAADVIDCVSAFAHPVPSRLDGPDGHVFERRDHNLLVRMHPDGWSFSLSLTVGQLDDRSFEEVAPRLLAANMACEPHAFALDVEGGVILTQAFSLERSTAQSLGKALQELSGVAAAWRGFLHAYSVQVRS